MKKAKMFGLFASLLMSSGLAVADVTDDLIALDEDWGGAMRQLLTLPRTTAAPA